MDSSNANSQTNFYDFLNRMHHPGSADLLRAIKSFIVSFSLHTTDAENESRKVQDFLASMEITIRDHPLWAHASNDEIENALEGLEKYIMTKLFNRTFASYPEDVKSDTEISQKIGLLKYFLKPEHLDIPGNLYNEALWLFAANELQKINAFKAPREKLLCFVKCCRLINSFLLSVSMSTNCVPAGADDFLPILIFVVIKANPPQLHSNLRFIQLFRRRSKLVSEEEYYLTNFISAKSFIANVIASSLSMEESEFESHMQSAKLATEGRVVEPGTLLGPPEDIFPAMGGHFKGNKYPFMEAEVGDLTVGDVHNLLGLYKKVVTRYLMLSQALHRLPLDENQLLFSVREDLPTRGLDVEEGSSSGNNKLDEVKNSEM